jgi:protein CWC15
MQRPTFGTAKGGGAGGLVSQGGYFTGGAVGHAVSVRALPSHTTLKFREAGQATESDLAQQDLRRNLEQKERLHFEKLKRERLTGGRAYGFVPGGAGAPSAAVLLQDAAANRPSAAVTAAAPSTVDAILAAFEYADADDDVLDAAAAEHSSKGRGQEGEGSEEEEEEEEDDTEELMRELERIKREREEERARKAREVSEIADRAGKDAAAKSNPLLASSLAGADRQSAALKRRFGDDTVFSHTHASEPEAKKRFINDMLRSDFHRKFLKQYVS